MSHNVYIANPERAFSTFEALCKDNDPRVLDWFKTTLYKYWLRQWSTRGAAEKHKPLPVPNELLYHPDTGKALKLQGTPAGKDHRSFVQATIVIRPPALWPLLFNEEGGLDHSHLGEIFMKALKNGASMRMFSPKFSSYADSGHVQHVRDFLQYLIDSREIDEAQKGKTQLSKIGPEAIPMMMVEWDRGLRKAAELAETEGALAVMHTGTNGWTVAIVGSQQAATWVGHQLRNCLRHSTSYFRDHTLLVVRNETGKVITAISCDMYKRVSGIRLNCKTKPGFNGPFPVTAMALNQFYAAENEQPPREAVDAFNEMCIEMDIRDKKDVNVHMQTDPKQWLDADEDEEYDEEEEGEDDEEDDEDEPDEQADDEEDEAPRRGRIDPRLRMQATPDHEDEFDDDTAPKKARDDEDEDESDF